MTRTCVRDREARKQFYPMYVLEKSEPVIKCDAIMIERLCAEDIVIAGDHSAPMEAILIRDQRTTAHRVFDRCLQPGTVLSLTTTTFDTSSALSSRRSRPETNRVQSSKANLHLVPNTWRDKNDVRTYSNVPRCDPCLVTRSSSDRRIRTPRFTTSVLTWLSKFFITHFFFRISFSTINMQKLILMSDCIKNCIAVFKHTEIRFEFNFF